MFQTFQNNFTESYNIENPMMDLKGIPFKYSELLFTCGGKTYDRGLYTIHTFESSVKWTNLLKGYFPWLTFNFIAFGYDWLGRQYCVPIGIGEYILVLDPTTQEDFHMDTNLLDFHNDFMIINKDEFFILNYFQKILNYLKIKEVPYNSCLGFKVSLFLNGQEEVSNYQLCDMEVYWDFENQIFNQIRNLPPGTKIGKVLINPFTDGIS